MAVEVYVIVSTLIRLVAVKYCFPDMPSNELDIIIGHRRYKAAMTGKKSFPKYHGIKPDANIPIPKAIGQEKNKDILAARIIKSDMLL